ncbi:MAG: hypothetical protein GY804_07180 [Alphaproteobacteria bacterium]|nr:hypothetical protein [Alphaproteobacteria bacterium]
MTETRESFAKRSKSWQEAYTAYVKQEVDYAEDNHLEYNLCVIKEEGAKYASNHERLVETYKNHECWGDLWQSKYRSSRAVAYYGVDDSEYMPGSSVYDAQVIANNAVYDAKAEAVKEGKTEADIINAKKAKAKAEAAEAEAEEKFDYIANRVLFVVVVVGIVVFCFKIF